MTTSEQAVFDATTAERILRDACRTAQVDPDNIEMLRFGDHAVFRLAQGRIIARVGRSPDRMPSVLQEVAVAKWLTTAEFPTPRLVTAADQPLVISGHPVTFWEALADGDTYASTQEMGELLRRLHALPSPPFTLPRLEPFEKVGQRLQRAVIPTATRTYLESLAQRLSGEYEQLSFALPPGPLHGDFNVGNVLRDAAGNPKVIDLDTFSDGPREWDLMQTAMYYDSFGWHSEEEYMAFVDGYGFDVRKWAGYKVLRSVRELLMVTWLSQNAGTNPQAAAEVEKRVDSLRTGRSRRDWAPF